MPAINVKINPAYMPYLNSDKKYQIYFGSAGSGKSRFIAQKLVMLLLKEKRKLLCIRQTFASMRDSVFAELKSVANDMGVGDIIKFKEATLNVVFPNGSTIIMKGADDEQKLLSVSGISDCWVEEATEISQEIFEQLQLRVREPSMSNHFYLSFNPISRDHWIRTRVVENPEILKDGFVCHTTFKDNMFLPDSYLAAMEDMRKNNPRKYQVYGLGEWGATGKTIFDNWEVRNFNINDVFKSHPNIQQYFGLDWGYANDPSAFVYALVDTTSMEIFIIDEMYKTGMLNHQIAEWLIKNGYQRSKIIADSAEQKSIADLKRNGIVNVTPARKGKGSIGAGLDLISSFKVIIHPNCINAANEFANYSYKKNRVTGEYTNEPQEKYNHLIDALRYALEELLHSQRKARTISKSVLGL